MTDDTFKSSGRTQLHVLAWFWIWTATVYKCPLILLSPLWQMPPRHQVAHATAILSGHNFPCVWCSRSRVWVPSVPMLSWKWSWCFLRWYYAWWFVGLHPFYFAAGSVWWYVWYGITLATVVSKHLQSVLRHVLFFSLFFRKSLEGLLMLFQAYDLIS